MSFLHIIGYMVGIPAVYMGAAFGYTYAAVNMSKGVQLENGVKLHWSTVFSKSTPDGQGWAAFKPQGRPLIFYPSISLTVGSDDAKQALTDVKKVAEMHMHNTK